MADTLKGEMQGSIPNGVFELPAYFCCGNCESDDFIGNIFNFHPKRLANHTRLVEIGSNIQIALSIVACSVRIWEGVERICCQKEFVG